MNSSNGLVVILTIAKLLKILKPYIEEKKLSHFDRNLFNSFYSSIYLEDKPIGNVMGALASFFKNKIAQPEEIHTNTDLLIDRSVLEPMMKQETIGQSDNMKNLIAT